MRENSSVQRNMPVSAPLSAHLACLRSQSTITRRRGIRAPRQAVDLLTGIVLPARLAGKTERRRRCFTLVFEYNRAASPGALLVASLISGKLAEPE